MNKDYNITFSDNVYIPDEVKTEIKISNYTLYINKRFNWFQKKMLKFCFGFDSIYDL